MDDYRKEMYHDRLIKYAARYHKRWGTLTFDDRLTNVQFFDVPFDNGLGLLGTVPALHSELNIKNWWFNGHLICNTNDKWSPRIAKEIAEIFSKIKFKGTLVINIRDFPWVRKDSKVPFTFYNEFLPAEFFEVEMHRPLSFYGGPQWHDLLMPPPEHFDIWNKCSPLRLIPKNNKAIFRGTLTGKYTDVRNARVRLCNLKHPKLDAGFTAWTNRERVFQIKNAYLHIALPPPSPVLYPKLTLEEQAAYGIQIYVPGHVASSRLGWQMSSGSAVIMIEDDSCVAPDMWFSNRLDISIWNGSFDYTCNAFQCSTWELGEVLDSLSPENIETMAKQNMAVAQTLDPQSYLQDVVHKI